MNFLSVLYARAGITVDGVTTLNNTATGQTPATNDNSSKLATTGYVKNQNYYPYPTGTTAQYVRGDGSLATFTQTGGGGSSVSYYLNGGTSQGVIGGNTYYEMSKTAVVATGVDFTINADGYVAQFVTDAGDPALLSIPGGNWNLEMFFSASSGGGSPSYYVELYKYNGTTLTLIASSSATPEYITGGTAIDLYTTALAVPTTTLTLTDRLAIRVYVTHSGRTITLHTQNGHLCQVITTFTTGLTALNGLTAQVQNFAVGAGGSDFNISSVTDTHTFNLPTASATKRGALSSIDWSAFDAKVDFGDLSATAPLNYNGSGLFTIAQSSGSTNGYLSSTDWTTFNAKIGGSGTTNYITKWVSGSAVGNSLFFSDANVAKTIYSSLEKGLYIDFANEFYALGDGNATYNGSTLIIDDTNQIIKTQNQGADKGLYIDFANGNYFLQNINQVGVLIDDNNLLYLGDFNEAINGTYIKIDVNNQAISTYNNSFSDAGFLVDNYNGLFHFQNRSYVGLQSYNDAILKLGDYTGNIFGYNYLQIDTDAQIFVTKLANTNKGLYVDFGNAIYALGFTETGDFTNEGVQGFAAQEGLFTIGDPSALTTGDDLTLNCLEHRFYINTNRTHLKNLTTTQINALTGNQEGDVTYNNTTHSLYFYNGTTWGAVSSGGTVTGTGTTNYVTKWVGGSAVGNSIIYDNGTNVGIGETNPNSKLHVSTTSSNPFRMVRTGGSATNFGFEMGSGDIGFYNYSSSSYGWYLTSVGRFGIGTTNPQTKFEVYGGHTDTTARLYSTGNGSTLDASLDMWASEPGLTYDASGIGNNVNGSPFYGRRNSSLGQSYIRFYQGEIIFYTGSTTGSTALTLATSGVATFKNNIILNSAGSDRFTVTTDGVVNWNPTGVGGFLTWDTGKAIVGANNSYALSFYTGGSERLIISGTTGAATFGSSVSVNGVGLTPSVGLSALNIRETATFPSALSMTNRNANQVWTFAIDTDVVDDGNFGLFNGVTSLQAIKITPAGAATFVSSVTTGYTIGINGTLNSSYGSVAIDHPGVQTWRIGITNSNTSTFSIGNDLGGLFATKVFNITQSGNVLIGTTVDAGYKLSVNGSAIYSGNVRIENAAGGTALLQLVNNETSPNNNNWSLLAGFGSARQFQIRDNLGGERFSINGTGAAYFSSSITSNGVSTINAAETYLNAILKINTTGSVGSTGGYVEYQRSGTPKFYAGIGVFDGLDTYQIGVTTSLFTILSTGAATFSSSVTATNFIVPGGTSAQFLKADGSLDSSVYLTATSSTFSYTSTVTLSPTWQNTGVSSLNLGTGAYLVTCNADDYSVGGGQYNCTYTGLMYFFAGSTNGSDANEIVLHHTGHADNGRYIYLRTLNTYSPDNKTYLQISGNGTNSGASNYQFTFKKLL
jgi:hypothetical protein